LASVYQFFTVCARNPGKAQKTPCGFFVSAQRFHCFSFYTF